MRSPASIATNRRTSFFAEDLKTNDSNLREIIKGKRVLAIGAAGSIGSSTVFRLCTYQPQAIHVVDQNENGLAEFVRIFRSSLASDLVDHVRTMPLDYGTSAMELLLANEGPYDIILNFAAIKHVRSEKDEYSIMQMLDTNIVKQARFMRWIGKYSKGARYFSVSTDKAANPSSFMGATKRIMEHIMFSEEFTGPIGGSVTSARFANVAFSNGSLLQSFENRFSRLEPIACPKNIRRYFVSLEESGEICTLASMMVEPGYIAVPRLDPKTCLVPLQGIAEKFIQYHGYEPSLFEDENEAKVNCAKEIAAGRWPLILTPSDTAGEKPYEEFIAEGENAERTRLKSIDAIKYSRQNQLIMSPLVEALERIVVGDANGENADKERIKSLIAELEPAFLMTHRVSSQNLDQRM